jgi:CheY-like chemotaxis protein
MGKRLLLVEPDWETRRLVADALHGLPFELALANSGEQALDALGGPVVPELVLLEPAMSGVSGWEVLARIDADPRLARVPVLIVTGLPDACAPGDRPVLGKPFTTAQLLAAISVALTSEPAVPARRVKGRDACERPPERHPSRSRGA